MRTKQIPSREREIDKVDTTDTTIRHGEYHGMRVEEIFCSPTRQSYDVGVVSEALFPWLSCVSSSSSEASFILILPAFIILIAQIHYL